MCVYKKEKKFSRCCTAEFLGPSSNVHIELACNPERNIWSAQWNKSVWFSFLAEQCLVLFPSTLMILNREPDLVLVTNPNLTRPRRHQNVDQWYWDACMQTGTGSMYSFFYVVSTNTVEWNEHGTAFKYVWFWMEGNFLASEKKTSGILNDIPTQLPRVSLPPSTGLEKSFHVERGYASYCNHYFPSCLIFATLFSRVSVILHVKISLSPLNSAHSSRCYATNNPEWNNR